MCSLVPLLWGTPFTGQMYYGGSQQGWGLSGPEFTVHGSSSGPIWGYVCETGQPCSLSGWIDYSSFRSYQDQERVLTHPNHFGLDDFLKWNAEDTVFDFLGDTRITRQIPITLEGFISVMDQGNMLLEHSFSGYGFLNLEGIIGPELVRLNVYPSQFTAELSEVPEPGTVALLLIGAGLLGVRKKYFGKE